MTHYNSGRYTLIVYFRIGIETMIFSYVKLRIRFIPSHKYSMFCLLISKYLKFKQHFAHKSEILDN